MNKPVYLDYAATTPVDPGVVEVMSRCLSTDGLFANPASTSHEPGRRARERVEEARQQVATAVNASPAEIVWTSGATESDNLAVVGAARFHRDRGRHIVTARTEHKAILDTAKQLEREGFRVTYLVPDRSGLIDVARIEEALGDDTLLVSIMHVNNETGVIQDIGAVGALCRERGVLSHVDMAQSVGKTPVDLKAMQIDLASFSAHKVYGPKGIGALYVCRDPRCRIEAVIHGGGQEGGLRPGTLATHQIAGMGEAFRLATDHLTGESARIRELRDRLWDGIQGLGGIHLNGDPERRVPGILNVSVEGVEGESLFHALRDLAVSSGSACNTGAADASYVLRALGRDDQLAQASVRFSLGRFTTPEEVDFAIRAVCEQVPRLRGIAPL